MEKDRTYKYFQTALYEWIDKNRKDGEAPQKLLSIKMGITEGTVSKYVSPKREKPIPYEMQVLFANACEHELFSFLQVGKNILEAKEPLFKSKDYLVELTPEKKATNLSHRAMDKFHNKERAIRLNKKLVKLEERDPEKLRSIEDLMDAWLSCLPEEDSLQKGLMNGTLDAK